MWSVTVVADVVKPLFRRVTYVRLAYLALSPVLGTTYLLLLGTGLTLGLLLVVLWVGVPILLGVLGLARWLATFDRTLANALLGTAIVPPQPSTPRRSGTGAVRTMLRDPVTWRSLLWVIARGPIGLFTSTVLSTWAILVGALVVTPALHGDDGWPVPGWLAWLALPVLVLGLPHLAHALTEVHVILARQLLGPPPSEQLAAVRRQAEELAHRNRLARELHDSVGHTLTVGVVQAAAAERVFDSDPEFAKEALATIADAHRDALRELDRVLGALREDAVALPAPGLAAVDALVASARAAGLPLTLTVTGDTEAIAGVVGTEAYRIVQEALTNVLRHAGLVPTTVTIAARGEELEVTVENGPPDHRPTMGAVGRARGLRGVSERVRSLGGAVAVGPTATGGFRLSVVLPLRPPS
jgi:signal transduction histidine kinase